MLLILILIKTMKIKFDNHIIIHQFSVLLTSQTGVPPTITLKSFFITFTAMFVAHSAIALSITLTIKP